MSRKLLIQCGRLDPNYNTEIEFGFNSVSGKSELSGLFLTANIDSFEQAKRLLIFPESIALQNWTRIKGNDSFLTLVANLNPDEYLKNPVSVLETHPHVKAADILVVSSLGYFKFNDSDRDYRLETSLDRIAIQMFLFLASKYSQDDLEEIYLDISSGQNIYIAALLNAAYRFLPFIKFKRFLLKEKGFIHGYILNSDPIFGKPEYTINIRKSKFSAKAFNTLTYKDSAAMEQLVKLVFKETCYYQSIQSFIKDDYFFLHGALIQTCPLAVSFVDNNSVRQLFDEIKIEKILSDMEEHFSRKWPNDENNEGINLNLIYALAFALGIGSSVYYFFKSTIETGEMHFTINKEQKNLENNELRSLFNLLDETYGQPQRAYFEDLKGLIKDYEKLKKTHPTGFCTYSDHKRNLNPKYRMNKNFNPRNYFAHGGFEQNLAEIKIEDDLLSVKYNQDLFKRAKKSVLRYLKK